MLLPQPDDLNVIKYLYDSNTVFHSYDKWKARHDNLWYTIEKLQKDGPVSYNTPEYDILDAHMYLRSLHQANEACNRLWATVELFLHAEENNLFCDKFNAGFLPTSTVPTLHYANITALVSILSLYGVCLLRLSENSTDMNLIRSGGSMHLVKRSSYIQELTGSGTKKWHKGILSMYEGLLKLGVKLPEIDLTKSHELLSKRNKLDYDLLGQTTMSGAFGEGIYLYFLRYVCSNLECAITSINHVVGKMNTDADERFYQLKGKVEELTK